MKLTLKQISAIIEILSSIHVDNFKINYWIYRNTENLKSSYDFMMQNRNNIYSKYLEPDENGDIITIDEKTGNYKFNLKESSEESIKEFENKMNELFNLECDVDIYTINVDVLFEENIPLTPYQISKISCLLAE